MQMLRDKLIESVCEIAQARGYDPYSGFAHKINGELKNMPAIWIEPPVLIGITGRREGVLTYKITLKVICRGSAKAQSEKDKMWSNMEGDIVMIYKDLNDCGFVANVRNIRCEPAENTLTNGAEISCSASFEVEMMYCEKHLITHNDNN